MTYAATPVRPILSDEDYGPEECPFDKTELDAGWFYCPHCGDEVAEMSRGRSDFLCSCSNQRMGRRGTSPKEAHECGSCGAIWVGLDRLNGEDNDRDPDRWNEAKAREAYAAYLKSTFGVKLPVAS